MEEKIKNFDRKIEQMMNETAVAPPFGMWNRISAGLDAEALPIAAAAPASWMPKRAIIGLVAGALVLGGLLTAYLMNNKTVTQPEVVNVSIPEVVIPEVKIAEPQQLVIKEAAPVAMVVTKKEVVSMPVVTEAVKEELPVAVSQRYTNSNEVAVPNQMLAQNATTSIDPYYFPPVDVNNAVAAKIATTAKKAVDEDDETEVVEKKKVVSSSSREKKLRPKKKRSSSFSYGRINRYKDPK